MTVFHLPSTPENILWGRLPARDSAPVLAVPSGSTVVFETLSHEGLLEDQGRNPDVFFGAHGVPPEEVLPDARALAASALPHDFDADGPHVLTGPVRVEGALPGDVLKVEILSLEPRVRYGVIVNRQGKGALPGEFPEGLVRQDDASPAYPERYGSRSVFARIERHGGGWRARIETPAGPVHFPANFFLGTMGVAADTAERRHSAPPSNTGGNIDIVELGRGATLYLPIEAPGALFFAGDPHLAQGCGEVALSALEGSLGAALRLTVLKKGDPGIPGGAEKAFASLFAENEDYWIPVGLNEDLDEAMKMAVRESVAFLSGQFGLERHIAYAYLSAATDYVVSQVVDRTKGIHGRIAKADFADLTTVGLIANGRRLPLEYHGRALYCDVAATLEALGISHTIRDGVIRAAAMDRSTVMTIDSNRYRIDGESVPLSAPPLAVGDATLMPVRALPDVLGITVAWATVGTAITGRADTAP